MPRYFVIPLYDHTTEEELEDVRAELDRLAFSLVPYVAEGELPRERARDRAPELGELGSIDRSAIELELEGYPHDGALASRRVK